MGKSNIHFIFSILLFCGSQEAKGRGLFEDIEDHRILSSIRLKFEVLKEFFLPSCSLLVENGREESFAIPSHDTDSQRIDPREENFPMDRPLYAERSEEDTPLAKVQTMEVNIEEMNPAWFDKYLRGLPKERQVRLLKSYDDQLANFDPDKNTVSMEIIDEKERSHIGGVLENEETGERIQIKYHSLNEEGEQKIAIRYWNPDGQVMGRIIEYPSMKELKEKLEDKIDFRRVAYDGLDSLYSPGMYLAGLFMIIVGGNVFGGTDSMQFFWSSIAGGATVSLGGLLGVRRIVSNKHIKTYKEHVRHLLDVNRAGNIETVSKRKFRPIIRFFSKELFKKICKENQ